MLLKPIRAFQGNLIPVVRNRKRDNGRRKMKGRAKSGKVKKRMSKVVGTVHEWH